MADNRVESTSGNHVCELRYCFTWSIYNFSKCPRDVDEPLVSPAFKTAALGDTVWHLHVYPRGEVGAPHHVGLYLQQIAEEHKSHTVAYKFSILNAMSEPCNIASDKMIFKGTSKIGSANFIERNRLVLDDFKRNISMLPSDKLTVQCDLVVSFDVKPSEYAAHELQMVKATPGYSNLAKLSEDLRNLFSDGKFTDFKLCVGRKEFLVHKNILWARSPVFAGLLDLQNTNRMNIQGVDPSVMKLLIQFMYFGQVDGLTFSTALGLYAAAQKYALPELKPICSVFLAANLTEDHVCEVLILSEVHQDQKLKSVAKEFIKSNSHTFLATDSWKNLLRTNPCLSTEIMALMQ